MNSGSSRVDLNDYESERQKFLAEGGCPGQTPRIFVSGFSGFYTHLFPPPTFLLLRPNASKNAAIARYCSRSLRRALDESMAAGFLVTLMGRLIPDRDPTGSFLCKFSENGGPIRGCK